MNNWIFVISDTDKEFKRRLSEKKWPIYHFTVFRKKIRSGDNVVFYKAGTGGQKLIGKAITASAIVPIGGKLDYFVKLKNIEPCSNPVSMHPLVEHLEFIQNKKHWGTYMQGGVRPITKNDYETIVSKF